MNHNRNAVLRSTGSYAPERILTNQYFNDLLGEDVSTWLETNVNIYERHWCADDESTADLCVHAAQKALQKAAVTADMLDLLIIATDTPEYISPSTASVVQHRLGATRAGTFDINTACAGFVTAMDIATKYIRSDERYTNVLVVGAYAMSKYLDMKDKKTVTLFADGAGAALLSAEMSDAPNPRGYITSELHTQGQYHDWMGVYAGGTHQPITDATLAHNDHLLRFAKKLPKELNPELWTQMILDMTCRAGLTPQDVQHYFFTQININSIRETVERLNVPFDRTHNIMHKFGYTGSACIPMALDDASGNGKLQSGDVACFVGSGGGLSFAGSLFRL